MNVGIDYDDDLELSRTHIDLLPKPKQVQPVTKVEQPVTDCRSVLGDISNRDPPRRKRFLEKQGADTSHTKSKPRVTWSQVVRSRG